jgi:hypothetical protein
MVFPRFPWPVTVDPDCTEENAAEYAPKTKHDPPGSMFPRTSSWVAETIHLCGYKGVKQPV